MPNDDSHLLDPLVRRDDGDSPKPLRNGAAARSSRNAPVAYEKMPEGFYRVHVSDWAAAARHARARATNDLSSVTVGAATDSRKTEKP